MTGDITTTRYGSESRPSRTHQHLLHSSKTDEIEVLESVTNGNIINGIPHHQQTKVSLPKIPKYFILQSTNIIIKINLALFNHIQPHSTC